MKLQNHFLKEDVGAYLCGSVWEVHYKHTQKGETLMTKNNVCKYLK